MVINFVDILFSIATICFASAAIRQTRKIYKEKKTDGISLTHYHIKIIAVVCMMMGYILESLPLSLILSLFDMVVNLIAIYLITKYRGINILGW